MLQTSQFAVIGFQQEVPRAQTCNGSFRIHRLATDTDLREQMKWFRNTNFPEKRNPIVTNRIYGDLRPGGLLERQKTFAGNTAYSSTKDVFAISGTKMDMAPEKQSRPKLWSQEVSRSLPTVAECYTPPFLPARPPPKRANISIRRSHTTAGVGTKDRQDKKSKIPRTADSKLPQLIREITESDRNKATQTSAKRPPGGWRSLGDETPTSRNTARGADDRENVPKFLPEVQSARESNRRNESVLPVEPLPFILTPSTAAVPGTIFTPANTLASNQTPESRNTNKSRRGPIPFRNPAHSTFI